MQICLMSMFYVCVCVCVCSVALVVSNSAIPWTIARLLCPWDFPGKNTGMGCHALLPGIFPNPGLSHHGQILYHLSCPGSLYVLMYGT